MGDLSKNASHLEKFLFHFVLLFYFICFLFTLRKVGHIWENGSYLEKRATLGKMGHTRENGSHFEKRVTLVKMGRTCKTGPKL